MSWTWALETADGQDKGRSPEFDSRGDAESWIGETFAELLDQGVDQARLLDGDDEVYGPMSLHGA